MMRAGNLQEMCVTKISFTALNAFGGFWGLFGGWSKFTSRLYSNRRHKIYSFEVPGTNVEKFGMVTCLSRYANEIFLMIFYPKFASTVRFWAENILLFTLFRFIECSKSHLFEGLEIGSSVKTIYFTWFQPCINSYYLFVQFFAF